MVAAPRVLIVHKPSANAVAVSMGFATDVTRDHDDYPALLLAAAWPKASSPAEAVVASLQGGFLIALVVAVTVFEVYGFMGSSEIKLSGIPAVSLIMAVGFGVEFTAHTMLAFTLARGSRNARVKQAIDEMGRPTWHGAVSTMLAVLLLAFTGVEFVYKYFFLVYMYVILFGVLNGLLLLPLLLVAVGPAQLGGGSSKVYQSG